MRSSFCRLFCTRLARWASPAAAQAHAIPTKRPFRLNKQPSRIKVRRWFCSVHRNKLGHKGQKEKCHFGIEQVGDKSLEKDFFQVHHFYLHWRLQRLMCWVCCARPQQLHTHVNQIRCTHPLQGIEGQGRCGQQEPHTKGGCRHVHTTTGCDAHHRRQPRLHTRAQRLAHDVQHIRSRRKVEQHARGDEQAQVVHGHHGRTKKFLSMAWPCSVKIDSGWNCTPSISSSVCRTPMISPSSVHAVTLRQGGQVALSMASEW